MDKIELIKKAKIAASSCESKMEFKKKYNFLYKLCCREKIHDIIFPNYNSLEILYKKRSKLYNVDYILDLCKTINKSEFVTKYGKLHKLWINYYKLKMSDIIFKKKKRVLSLVDKNFKLKYGEQYLTSIISNMKFRNELLVFDEKLYKYFKNRGLFKTIGKHLKLSSISRSQHIMTYIMNKLLNDFGDINNRTEIKPLEIDLFYKKYNLGFEYNGSKWHENMEKDKYKIWLSKNRGITILTIREKNHYFYENDIKNQIIDLLPEINICTNLKLTPKNVLDIIIDYKEIIEYDIDQYKEIAVKYNNLQEFRSHDYSIYHNCKSLNILDLVTGNMKAFRWTIDSATTKAKEYKTLKEFRQKNRGAYSFLMKNGGYGHIGFNPRKNYYFNMSDKEIIDSNKSINFMFHNNLPIYRHVMKYRKYLFDIIPQYDNEYIKEILLKYDSWHDFIIKESLLMKYIKKNNQIKIVSDFFKSKNYNKYFTMDINLNEIKEICSKYKFINLFSKDYPKICKFLRKNNLIDQMFPHIKTLKLRNNRKRKNNLIIKNNYF